MVWKSHIAIKGLAYSWNITNISYTLLFSVKYNVFV